MSNDLFTGWEDVSITPVEGWRIAYIDTEEQKGYWTEPMAGWLTVAETIFSKRTYKAIEDQPPLTERRREIRPAVYFDFMEDATGSSDYWKLIAPGKPDPTPEEVKAENEFRALRDKKLAELKTKS